MAWVAAVAAGGAQALKTYQQTKLLEAQEEGIRDAKNRRMASATREIAEEERAKKWMHSDAVALAAAGGAGVDSPGMVQVLGDINAEGTYRMMIKLWQGLNDAQGLNFQADAVHDSIRDTQHAGIINAVASAFSAYSGAGGGGGGGGSFASGEAMAELPSTMFEPRPVGGISQIPPSTYGPKSRSYFPGSPGGLNPTSHLLR